MCRLKFLYDTLLRLNSNLVNAKQNFLNESLLFENDECQNVII